jgi:ABC-type transporter Mla MlaB component
MAASAQRSASIAIHGPLLPEDLPGLFERACALLARESWEVLRCELTGVAADAVALDALARLALRARRQGCGVLLCGASRELRALVCFAGLDEVLRAEPPTRGDRGLSSRPGSSAAP